MNFAEIPVWLAAVAVFAAWWIIRSLGRVNAAKVAELRKENAVFVDVRSPGEYAQASLPNTLNIPVNEIARLIPDQIPDRKTPVLCFCASGTRSSAAVSRLRRMGYQAYNIGGYHRARSLLKDAGGN